jgi:hypothetical protein
MASAAYDLGTAVSRGLMLGGLAKLPLAVAGRGAQRTYCFPSAWGRWVEGQGAIDASLFLARFLLEHHRALVEQFFPLAEQLLASQGSHLALLRAVRPCLPGVEDLRQAYARACSGRIAFADGT